MALYLPRVELLAISPEIAVQATMFLENFRGDPADRLIAATTIKHHTILVTKDERLHGYKPLQTLW